MREIRIREEARLEKKEVSDIGIEDFGEWKMSKFKSYARDILIKNKKQAQ